MALESVVFIQGRMNKSIDERLLPQGEYVDAQNVRLGSTETTEVGAVENSRGNTRLTTLQFAGQSFSPNAVCIGAYEDGITETVYWFVHDANNPVTGGRLDAVVSYNTQNQGITYHVFSSSVLNFQPSYLITGVNLIDDLLFWTDDINPPRKININRSYAYPASPGYNDLVVAEDFNVIQKPPGYGAADTLSAPSLQMVNVNGQENYLENRFISFAYRYRYQDDEYSATSLFSLPAFQPNNFFFSPSNYVNEGMLNRFNAANVSFNTGSSRVKQVDLLYKDSNTNSIYVIERFDKDDYGWADNTTQTFLFTNSKIYTTLGADELLRLYDNVPRFAKAQTIMGNRLIYGNYVDGYNMTNASGGRISVDYSTSLKAVDVDFEILPDATLTQGIAYTLSGSSIQYNNSLATFNLTDIATKLKKDSTIRFVFRITTDQLNGDTANPCYLPTFSNGDTSLTLNFTLPTDYNSVYDMASSSEFQARVGTVLNTNYQPIATCADGTSVTDNFNCALSTPTNCPGWTKHNSSITDASSQQGWGDFITTVPGSNNISFQPLAMNYRETNAPVTNLFEYFRFESGTITFSASSDVGSLHSNRDYETGIVYMDDYGRASTVLVSEYNTIFVPAENSDKKNSIQARISNLPPSWATRYKFVVKPSKGNYETVYSNFFYVRPSNNVVYFKLEGDNQNKCKKGDTLIVKRDVNGPRQSLTECEVLDISAEAEDFLDTPNELGSGTPGTSHQIAGLYMQIKAQNFSVAGDLTDPVINNGVEKYKNKNENRCKAQVNYKAFIETSGPVYEVYDVPAGSIITIKCEYGRNDRSGQNCPGNRYVYDKTFTSSQNFTNLYEWAIGDNFDPNTGTWEEGNEATSIFVTTIANSAANIQCTSPNPFEPTWQFWQAGFSGTIDPAQPLYLSVRSGIKGCNNLFGDSFSYIELEIIVTRANDLLVFETEPTEANDEIFFDASKDFPITGGFHISGTGDGDQNQTATQDAVVDVPFINCYTFGNGVESFKILDKIATKSLVMGQRALAVSNADFKEADRFAGLTYSGVFSYSTNTNNLNEFNLGLVNFKDLEQNFGPVMKLHGRETDILVLQEDKISYVQQGKDLLSDAVGGGAVVSTPEVLGKQIARIEEYGISFNPESFIQWGNVMYFTDTKRSAVIQLGAQGAAASPISIVSDIGMRSWFRDQFVEHLTTQKLGGYDPYMDEYVLSTNDIQVPFPTTPIKCGTTITINNLTAAKTFTLDFGEVIDSTTTVSFTVTGTASITGVWNSTNATPNPLNLTNASGTLTYNKSLNTPTTATVTITPTGSCSFTMTPNCPDETTLTVVQVVLNSSNATGDQIHVEYGWSDTQTISPIASTQSTFGSNSTVASTFFSQTGIRSLGVFPYQGSNFMLRTNKLEADNYNVGDGSYKFSFLSSNTQYNNTVADIATLTAGASIIGSGLVTNPTPDIYKADLTPSTNPAFSIPNGNQYLYLIYDFRTVSAQALCYDASSTTDACCDCTFTCTSWSAGTRQDSAGVACQQQLTKTYYFLNTPTPSTYPVIGSIVFTSTTCDATSTLPSGYYKYTSGWLRVDNNGIVIQQGTC